MLRRQGGGADAAAPAVPARDPEPLLFHGEPILRDGKIVGQVTSGNYGHTLGGAIGLGYVALPRGG